jgi:hypothetical protein
MKCILCIFASILFVTAAAAQTDSVCLKTKSLQFSFNGLNLGTINAGVGGKVWTTERTAVALALAGSHTFDKSDPNPNQSGTTSVRTAIQAQLGVEWHLDQSCNFSPYLVGAFYTRYERQRYEYTNTYSLTKQETISKETRFGISFGLGAEYWITKRLSLAGQHLFVLSYASGTQENNTSTNSTQATQGVDLGLGTSTLILSVYF